MPKQFEFRKELPKTLIGKPDRKALAEEEKAKREAAANENKGGSDAAPTTLRKRNANRFGM